MNNFELNIDTVTTKNHVALGDFNTMSNLWFNRNKTTYEGSKIYGTTSKTNN